MVGLDFRGLAAGRPHALCPPNGDKGKVHSALATLRGK